MFLETPQLIFLIIWAFVGSVLGFFAFTYDHKRSLFNTFNRCCLSIGIGLFIAIPLTNYFVDTGMFSKSLSIMLGGIGAFGLPDIILKYYPRVTKKLVDIFLGKLENGEYDRKSN